MLLTARALKFTMGMFGKKNISLHPDRVRKLMLSTNVSGKKLEASGFKLRYSLSKALEDWYRETQGKGLL